MPIEIKVLEPRIDQNKSIHNRVVTEPDAAINHSLIHIFQEPAMLVFDGRGKHFQVNKPLLKILKYRTHKALMAQVDQIFDIIDPASRSKFADHFTKGKITATDNLHLLNKNGQLISARARISRTNLSKSNGNPVWLCTFEPASTNHHYEIDKSLLDLFNNDRFLDEVLVIMDFEGNIISANRKLLVINFFADLSDKKFNLFAYIDSSYKDKLERKISQLKKGLPVPPCQYKLVNGENKSAYIELYSKSLMYKNRPAIAALIRDVTMTKETEKNLLHTIVQTEEKERQRFAHDLHDELGPFLSALKLYLNELQLAADDPDNRQLLFDYVHEMINEAVDIIRSITSNLTPQNMIDEGLTSSVRKMIRKLTQTGRIDVTFNTRGSDLAIEHSFVITLYRILQELINNSLKHSGGKNIQIDLAYRKKNIRMAYTEDGKGFDLKKELMSGKGIGLRSIINRIELYHGKYTFSKIQSGGFIFEMVFPR